MRNKKGQFIKGHKSIGGFRKGHKINVGKKHSQEWNDNIGESNKGRISPMKGKNMPESAKVSIGNALRGKPALKIRGNKHYNWKNNRSKLQKIIRHRVEYKIWRDMVFRRDNYTCQECGAKNGNGKTIILNADHYPKHFYKILDDNKIITVEEAMRCKELWDINNGRTLCRKCHKKTFKFHSNQYVKT